ncbi:uncharacterized protein [Porites lutea]|uniref:uncharacterized protein n=1 Tax=Porites lutea TaxID=51062 RepID=UPI003CC64606
MLPTPPEHPWSSKCDAEEEAISDPSSLRFSNLSNPHIKLKNVNSANVLKDNKIKELPPGIFSDLIYLQELDLRNNDIKELPSGIFSNLSSLQRLYLQKNKIEELPPGIFTNLTELRFLDLRDNEIKELPSGIFSNFSSLRTL